MMLAAIKRLLARLPGPGLPGGIYYASDPGQAPVIGRGVSSFCTGCVKHPRGGTFCRSSACIGAVQGHAIGDVWYFRCWLGLDSIAVAVAPEGEVVGAIEAGGFFSPGGTQWALDTVISRLSSLDSLGSLQALTGSLQATPELAFPAVKGIADTLLQATFEEGLNDPTVFAVRSRMPREREPGTRAGERGGQPTDIVDQRLASLDRLASALRRGSRRALMGAMDDFLGHLLVASENDPGKARTGVLTMLGILACSRTEGGTAWGDVFGAHRRLVDELAQLDDIESICFWIEKLLAKQLGGGRHHSLPGQEPRLSDRMLAWIRDHYAERVVLADAAHQVAASPSSVRKHLRAETGRTFTQHLRAARVGQAKRLLIGTNLRLGEIAERCGFSDQSYFSKVFSRQVNLTPRRFRAVLAEQDRSPEMWE